MIAFGRRGMIIGLHKASFVVWFGATGIHVLVYGRRLLRLSSASEWRARGAVLRAGVVVTGLGAAPAWRSRC